MKTRLLAAIGPAVGCLMFAADEPKQFVDVINTQRIDFPAGGALRLKNSIGVLTVEAWDRPDVEITTVKSTKVELDARGREKAARELEQVHVAAERRGNELVVTTEFHRYRAFPIPYPTQGESGFRLEYRIRAPATAQIIDEHHGAGEVNIYGLTGDIDVNLLQGDIVLLLPEGWPLQHSCERAISAA